RRFPARHVEHAGQPPRPLARSRGHPVDALTMDPHAEIACLMYHEVTDEPSSSGFQRPAARHYVVGRRAFDDQLARFRAMALSPRLVTDVDLAAPGRHLLLTFDDGGRSALGIGE